jgi:hypothetical protein
MNPPYAEGGNGSRQGGKKDVADTNTARKYKLHLGKATNELFAQFLIRIYCEIPGCKIAEFSKLKTLQAPNFRIMRGNFRAKLLDGFLCPGDSFDNVKGKFPIGLKIFDTNVKETYSGADLDVFDRSGLSLGKKHISAYECKLINDWFKKYKDVDGDKLFTIHYNSNDFQQQQLTQINSLDYVGHCAKAKAKNLMQVATYFTTRLIIQSTWLNDRDQFMAPHTDPENDSEFQSDCLTYMLFSNSNNIKSSIDTNHLIPFTESEVGVTSRPYKSRFLTDFIKEQNIEFSDEAKLVFKAGKDLWSYYHKQTDSNPDASYYEIREHCCGRNGAGRMNSSSDDVKYTELHDALKLAMRGLTLKIRPKIFEFGFLMK